MHSSCNTSSKGKGMKKAKSKNISSSVVDNTGEGTLIESSSLESSDGSDALRKVNTSYACDKISDKAVEKAQKLMNKLGRDAVSITFSTNWSDTKVLSMPSGLSLAVHPSAPIYAEIFPATKMFSSTSIYSLDGLQFKDGTPINEDYIIKNREKILSALEISAKDSSKNPLSSSVFSIESYPRDNSEWTESIGASGAYAGIYVSKSHGDQSYLYDKKYWLAIQSNFPNVSRMIQEEMEQSEPDYDVNHNISSNSSSHVTWSEFFGSNKAVEFALTSTSRSSRRTLAKVLSALDLDGISTETDIYAHVNSNHSSTGSKSAYPQMVKPILSTVTNIVRHDPSTNTLIFHSNTVNPSTIGSGIVLNKNPYLGPVILNGPPSHNQAFGSAWKPAKQSFGAFPTSTGRVMDFTDLNRVIESSISSSCSPSSSTNRKSALVSQFSRLMPLEHEYNIFTWENKISEPINRRLFMDVYRIRNEHFKQKERDMGYNHQWGETQLQPLAVKISSK